MKKQNKWLDNFGKADNANESNVSLPEDFNGLAYDTTGRNYSPAWGGQFQTGGSIPGTPGFTYARTINPAPSEGKYAKKTLPSAQNGIQQDATRIDTTIADKIAGLELRKSKEYQDRKYLESLPQLRQAPSREEELIRQGLRYADVATDAMQFGNFIPFPQAQAIGKVGNVAGSLIDAIQANLDFYDGDVGSGVINLASAALPSVIKNPNVIGGYKRSAKYAFGNRSTYLPIDKRYGRMTDKQLLGNRTLFGGLGAETVYDALPQKQNGGEMKFYQEGLDWKPKSMQDGGIVEDDMGYWNPDNHGKPVRINSNLITMEGVYEPLLGIDDTGDTKLMLPGENYKFKGKKVTEIPIAQKGITVPTVEGDTLPEVLVTDMPDRISKQNEIIQKTSPKKNYSIVDKKNNYIYYFSPKGEKIGTEPIITGASNNDFDKSLSMREFFERQDTDNHEEYFQYLKDTQGQTTPSGIYSISGLRTDTGKNPDKLGSMFNKLFRPEREKQIEDIRIKDYGAQQNLFTLVSEFGVPSSKAIHGTMRDDRVDALQSYDKDRNMSNGCVNVNGKTMCFETLKKGSGVYILPEESDDLLYASKTDNKEKRTNKTYTNTRTIIAQDLLSRGISADKESLDFIASVAEKESKGGRSKFAKIEKFLPYNLAKSQGKFQINPESFEEYLPENYDGSDGAGAEVVYNFYNKNKENNPVEMYRKYSGDKKGKYDKNFKSIYDRMSTVYKDGGKVNINDLDAQPKKKLNQLLNFTNNPDKNWLDNL